MSKQVTCQFRRKEQVSKRLIIMKIVKANSRFFVKIPQNTGMAYGTDPIVSGMNPICKNER